MNCPHCGEALPSILCPECGGETPEKSLYCCGCGRPIKAEEREKEKERAEDDFSQRILCSDGNCIGVINEKGVCSVCGKPRAGDRGGEPV
jgi:hypothetical protein